MYDVICYGTLCQDRIMRIPRYPSEGGSVWIEEDCTTIGGEAGNSARAFSAWGLETLLLGTVLGRDERAEWLLGELSHLPHVDTGWLTAAPDANTPYCNILATPDGERTMFGRHFDTMRGQSVTGLPAARVFTLDPYCGSEAVEAACAAEQAGIPIVAMDAFDNPEIAEMADYIVTSHAEVDPEMDEDRLLATVARATQVFEATVVLTIGPRGSVAFDEDGKIIHRQQAAPVEPILDATGCGDVYRAGLVCGLVHEWPLEEAMAFASPAASLNLKGMGGGGHTLSVEETRALAQQYR